MYPLVAPRLVRAATALAATGLLATLAACGGAASSASGSAGASDPAGAAGGSANGESAAAVPGKVDSIAALLPPSVAQKGTLVVAGATYPPAIIESTGGTEPSGWDVENVKRIAAVLGLTVEFKIIPFDGVIAGLQANRYDGATGEIYVTPERTKVVTFVTNHKSAAAMLVRADSTLSGQKPTDLCGHTVAAELGSAEAAAVADAQKQCAASGAKPLTPKTFKTQAEVNLALNEGRIDAAIGSASQVAYVVSKTGAKFKLVEMSWGPNYNTGLALARSADSEQLAKAVQAATDYLIKDGSLQKILDEFNDGQGLVAKAEIIPSGA